MTERASSSIVKMHSTKSCNFDGEFRGVRPERASSSMKSHSMKSYNSDGEFRGVRHNSGFFFDDETGRERLSSFVLNAPAVHSSDGTIFTENIHPKAVTQIPRSHEKERPSSAFNDSSVIVKSGVTSFSMINWDRDSLTIPLLDTLEGEGRRQVLGGPETHEGRFICDFCLLCIFLRVLFVGDYLFCWSFSRDSDRHIPRRSSRPFYSENS